MKRRILVVDDNEDAADLMEMVFSNASLYKVAKAMSYAEALRKGKKERFDAVVTDLQLGDGLGDHLMYELGPMVPNVRVLVTASGMYETPIMEDGCRLFDSCLLKPISPVALRDEVTRLLKEKEDV